MGEDKIMTGLIATTIAIGAGCVLWLGLAIGCGHSVARTGKIEAAMITPAWSEIREDIDSKGRRSHHTAYHSEEYHFIVTPDPVGDGDTRLAPLDKLVTRATYFTHQVGSVYRWDEWELNWKFWRRKQPRGRWVAIWQSLI